MLEIIAVAVAAIANLAGAAINSGAQKYAQRNAQYEAAIQFQRDKQTSLLSSYNAQQLSKGFVILGGLAALIALVYFLNKNK